MILKISGDKSDRITETGFKDEKSLEGFVNENIETLLGLAPLKRQFKMREGGADTIAYMADTIAYDQFND